MAVAIFAMAKTVADILIVASPKNEMKIFEIPPASNSLQRPQNANPSVALAPEVRVEVCIICGLEGVARLSHNR